MFFKLCALDPDKRPSAQDALRDPYFSEEPSALSPAEAVRELRALREQGATPERARRRTNGIRICRPTAGTSPPACAC